jgi:AmmeMemoRadiSam system protein B
MSVPERPRLRALAAAPEDANRVHYVVWDPLRVSDSMLKVTLLQLQWIQLFDGTRTLRDVQAAAMQSIGGYLIPLEVFEGLAADLDQALFFDSPRFRARVDSPIRPASCVNHYEKQPGGLRAVIEDLFTRPGGPGLPGEPQPDGSLRAMLIPHIDYGRGGTTYAWAFKEVFEKTPAARFVIIGTSHYSRHRFTLTRKHFQTPFGVAQTDQKYIDRLVHHYGPGLFDDELMAHLPEHSIELEVVFLQWYYASRRPFRIVPLVVGPFQDCVHTRSSPAEQDDIARMVRALQTVEQEATEPICYLISGDLAHIGPKFGDREPVSDPQLQHSRGQDEAILKQTESADPAGYFEVIAAEADQRRICGLPPTWLTLQATRPTKGKVLAYDQYVDPRGSESVSFASVGFYGSGAR